MQDFFLCIEWCWKMKTKRMKHMNEKLQRNMFSAHSGNREEIWEFVWCAVCISMCMYVWTWIIGKKLCIVCFLKWHKYSFWKFDSNWFCSYWHTLDDDELYVCLTNIRHLFMFSEYWKSLEVAHRMQKTLF